MANGDRKKELHLVLDSAKSLKGVIQQLYAEDTYFIGKYGSFKTLAMKYNQLCEKLQKHNIDVSILSYFNIEKISSSQGTTWPIQKEIIDNVFTNISLMISLLENVLEINKDVLNNIKDFIKSNLRKSIFEEPQNEKTIQNALESLFIGKGFTKGLDYDRETGRVKVSSKEVVPDFIIIHPNMAIEVKLIKEKIKIGPVIDEINADIISYSNKYSNILFIVYDLGFIRDENEFLSDFNKQRNVSCIIIKQ